MDNDIKWMNETMAATVWPDHSANLHDRIMARVDYSNVLPFGFRRPGLKLSAMAMAAMLAGFCVGMIGQPVTTVETHLAYNASPYYTGSGMTMVGMLEGTQE